MAGSPDLRKIPGDQDLTASRIGFRDGQMRIVLSGRSSGTPRYTILLQGLRCFFDHGVVNGRPLVASWERGVGSFGWWLPRREMEEHFELHLTSREDATRNWFRAIARDMTCRPFIAEEDLNYPG